METKISIVAIIISNPEAVEKVNSLLHDFRDYFIGRMGLPYKQKGVSIISAVLDCPVSVVNSLSGKLGMIEGVSSKVLTAK